MVIFIDSNIFLAYFNKRDLKHMIALNLMERITSLEYGTPFTSDYIFDESLTAALARTKNKEFAVKVGNAILSSNISFLKIHDLVFGRAWKLFKLNRLNLSFTDCTNIAFMEMLKTNKIATFDEEFKKVPGVKVVN